MNEYAIALQDDFATEIANIRTPDDVAEFVSKLQTTEKLLKAVNQFNSQARKFADLEARALLQIVELGLEEELPSGYWEVSLWLKDATPEEREAAIAACGEKGVTIRYWWKKNVHEGELAANQLELMKEMGDDAIDEFKEHGIVNLEKKLGNFEGTRFNRIPYDVKKGYLDAVRDRIRKAGGHGLGDGEGVYMTAAEARPYLAKVIHNKCKSIVLDVGRLMEICEETDGGDAWVEIKRYTNFTTELSPESAVGFMFCILGLAKPSWCVTDDVYKAEIVADMLMTLGASPWWLFQTLWCNSKQSGHPYWRFDMTRYGYEDDTKEAS